MVKRDGHLNGDIPRYFDWKLKASRRSRSRNQRLRSVSTLDQGRRFGRARSMSRRIRSLRPRKERWRMGTKLSNFAAFVSRYRRTFGASDGDRRAASAVRRSMSGVASKVRPSSNWRRYIGSRRRRSTSASKLRPQAPKISRRTFG